MRGTRKDLTMRCFDSFFNSTGAVEYRTKNTVFFSHFGFRGRFWVTQTVEDISFDGQIINLSMYAVISTVRVLDFVREKESVSFVVVLTRYGQLFHSARKYKRKRMNGNKYTNIFGEIRLKCVRAHCTPYSTLNSVIERAVCVCYKIMKINDRNLTAWWLFMAVTLLHTPDAQFILGNFYINFFHHFFPFLNGSLWVQSIESSCDSHGIDVFRHNINLAIDETDTETHTISMTTNLARQQDTFRDGWWYFLFWRF